MTSALNEHPTTAEILQRLAHRTDLPADVVAALQTAAELSVLREHDAHRAGYADGVANAGRGLPR